MTKIIKHYKIDANIKKVWDALTIPEIIEQWGAGTDIKMSDQEGATFSLWGGSIWGENIKVKINEKIVQHWYGGDWPEPSLLTITLKSSGNDLSTEVELIHENLPEAEVKDFDNGWDKYYFDPIKELLEKN